MGGKTTFRTLGALAGIAAGLALPGSALAADTYVDDSGVDVGTCDVPTAPCATINYALSQTGMNEDVFIGGGTYSQTGLPSTPGITLNLGKSLFGSNFNPPATSGAAIVDYGAVPPPSAPTIRVSGGNQVAGLTIRGDGDSAGVVEVQSSPTIQDNVFDSPGVFHIVVNAGGAGGTIAENTFTNPSRGVMVNPPAGATEVDGNVFTGVTGIGAAFFNATGTSEFDDNVVGLAGTGDGVNVEDAAAEIEDNEILSEPGSTATIGIQLFENPGVPNTSATMARNEILGIGNNASVGVRVDGVLGPVTLDSDMLVQLGYGFDQNPSAMAGGDVSAQNVTIADSGEFDAQVANNATLTLNSSTVDAGIFLGGGTGDCEVDNRFNNREPTYGLTPDVCPAADFATVLDPMFVNPAMDDYHLQPTSPLIDIGDTAAPPMGATDIDGDARALDGNGDGTVRRDVGADEFVFTPPPGGTGQTPVTPVTPAPAGPTGQRAAALKKCRKKKSKRARSACRKKARQLPL